MRGTACVVGSGPNGLSAAIVLAEAGFQVEVFESQPTPGGAARTMELTLPGFLHDFGSAVYPLGAGSPFFRTLPLDEYGLRWIRSPAALAHPFDDGTALTLEPNLRETEAVLGVDGAAWGKLMRPFVENWWQLAADVLRPINSIPQHPFLVARFGIDGVRSARATAARFRSERTGALFAGLAAHSFLALDQFLTAAFGMLMAVPAHVVGWPIPRGGAQALTTALCGYLSKLGGQVRTDSRIDALESVANYDLVLCDLTPKQFLKIASRQVSPGYKRRLSRFRYGPGAFKVDYALKCTIPWKAVECLRAATLHLGGSLGEIAASEQAVAEGRVSEHPFVLLCQPSLFDDSRAPRNQHTAWAYCHVPNGSKVDMLERLENQIERFAPGFRECILARRVFSPGELEAMDENLVGGDISGGAVTIRQLLFRPTASHYATSIKNVFLCSSSTPPAGGVHGMCGYWAAKTALAEMGIRGGR